MVSIGDTEPPADWQEMFKIKPETPEERYSRLSGNRQTRQASNGEV